MNLMKVTAIAFAILTACFVGRTEAAVELAAPGAESFALVARGKAAVLVVPKDSPEVVRIVAEEFASDVEAVTGVRPELRETPAEASDGPRVEIGIDPKLGKGWEAFQLSASPSVLTITGSDPRGLAYGMFELSSRIGVSPWHWWADVPVRKRDTLNLTIGETPVDQPAVKYRGIFINDEDWGLEPWASKTFEPEVGNIGPKTYARVFKLMLRLRANYLWPGMHPTTTPFHLVEGNGATADAHAIIVGSTHAEPMLLNNGQEWKGEKREFNFLTNRDEVLDYWEKRVMERTSGESLFTIGMRGIDDSPIIGPKGQKERIETLEAVFKAQREMLAKHLGDGDPTRVGQIFVPYKEVLKDYNAGLQVPEDAIIVWPDDNYGYIRRFGTPEEQKRSGGLGVYYHASYSGMPQSWLWVDTLPPALPWAEMTRAYEHGAHGLWIVNVGDIKNTERSMEFFLAHAWHADRADRNTPGRFIRQSMTRDFGEEFGEEVAGILERMQAINFERKAEHLQWHLSKTPYLPTGYNEAEILERLETCSALQRDSDALLARLPEAWHDAYFQLVGYPVGITAAANERYLRAELARADVARGRSPDANRAAAEAGEKRVDELTAHYNGEIAGGKWQHIVNENGYTPGAWSRFQRDVRAKRPEPAEDNVCPPAPPEPGPLPRPAGAKSGDFVERDGVVSIHAGHFAGRSDLPSGAGWQAIPGLGRSGSAVTVMPSTATITAESAPSLEYRFHNTSEGPAKLRVRLLPTFPLVTGAGLNFSIAIDGGEPIPLAVTKGFDTGRSYKRFSAWQTRVMANATYVEAELPEALKPGWHTLRLIATDAGVVVDKFVIAFDELPASYNGPDETRLR